MQFVVKHLDRIIGATRLRFVRLVGPGVFVSRRAQRDRRGLWSPHGHVHKKPEIWDVLDLWVGSCVVVASAEPDKLLRNDSDSSNQPQVGWWLSVSSQLENSPCCQPKKSPGKVANCNQMQLPIGTYGITYSFHWYRPERIRCLAKDGLNALRKIVQWFQWEEVIISTKQKVPYLAHLPKDCLFEAYLSILAAIMQWRFKVL